MIRARWINPPDSIRRFTGHQIAQHWAAAAFALLLFLTGSFPAGYPFMKRVHAALGLACTAFLLYHVLTLVVIGIRRDVPPEKVAFFPTGREWGHLRGRPDPYPRTGKYSPEEKGDYLAILVWSVLIATSGIFLRWPGSLGIPGPGAYGWLRVIHAGFGAALAVHILLVHIPGRWLGVSPEFRRAVFTGKVPLREAESREGWISDLATEAILVPVPQEMPSEAQRESVQVREFLEEGNRLAREGRYAEAAKAFEDAIGLFPGYSQARFNLAVARMKEGRQDLAAEQFRLFIEHDPFNPMAGRAREMLESIVAEGDGDDR